MTNVQTLRTSSQFSRTMRHAKILPLPRAKVYAREGIIFITIFLHSRCDNSTVGSGPFPWVRTVVETQRTDCQSVVLLFNIKRLISYSRLNSSCDLNCLR